MASGMELAINNAEEAAVNAPFNSTGLQTPGQFFFPRLQMLDERQLHQALWLCLRLHCQVFSPNLNPDGGAINGFSSGARLNGVSNFTNSFGYQRGAVTTEEEVMSTQRPLNMS